MPKLPTLKKNVIIAVDFDGTLVDHCYPDIGNEVPKAITYLKTLQELGIRLILYTMRSGETLDAAVRWCADRGITFWAVNANPEQSTWTNSTKVYAHIYIDDAALGCPLRTNPRYGGRDYVDWDAVWELLKEKFEISQ